MRSTAIDLSNFMLELIQSQIKKCKGLIEMGIGPDAYKSATLVKTEVEELIVLLEALLKAIKESSLTSEKLLTTLNPIKFYLDQEKFRADASHYVAPVPIHAAIQKRVDQQSAAIALFYLRASFQEAQAVMPQNAIQQQIFLASAEIALNILRIAAAPESKGADLSGPAKELMIKYAEHHKAYAENIRQMIQACEETKKTSEEASVKPMTPLAKEALLDFVRVTTNKVDHLKEQLQSLSIERDNAIRSAL